METPTTPSCNVCSEPLNPAVTPAIDQHLGHVCHPCKTELRWAHAWLSKSETGIAGCTTNWNSSRFP